MTIEELDRRLRELTLDSQRVGANLLELELDPNRCLLDELPLEGQSAACWASASAALIQLWRWHGLLEAHLEHAAKLRGTRTRLRQGEHDELAELVDGPSIEVTSEQVPLAQRSLLGSPEAAVRCSPGELLTRMSTAFDEVKTAFAEIAGVWDSLSPRLDGIRAIASESSELARRLGGGEPPELVRGRDHLTVLGRALAKDPLSVTVADFDQLEALLETTRRDLEGLAELICEIDARLAQARRLLAELRVAARESEAAHQEVMIKIASPQVPPPLVPAPAIEAQLEQVAALSRSGAWRQARDSLAQWTKQTTALLDEARRVTAENRAPIGTRDQLRGRLDAYQAKARQLGRIEDPVLSDIFARAHRALHTAPTDIAGAEELVGRYQRALAANPPAREVLT